MIAEFSEIEQFAADCLETAQGAARTIQFSVNARAKYARQSGELMESPDLIGNEPEFALLDTAFGMAAWSVILSVDLRDSSRRAIEIGARDTYLTMHTYLPTMAELVSKADGKIVGLRGDGLFAAFGLTKKANADADVTPEVAESAAQNSTRCAKAMLEATKDIINPLLKQNHINDGLEIGVGISVGEVVVTRIGLRDATEVTVYGPPVNQACKLCSKVTGIAMTVGVRRIYPSSAGGRVTFAEYGGGYMPNFPSDLRMLTHSDRPTRQSKPR